MSDFLGVPVVPNAALADDEFMMVSGDHVAFQKNGQIFCGVVPGSHEAKRIACLKAPASWSIYTPKSGGLRHYMWCCCRVTLRAGQCE